MERSALKLHLKSWEKKFELEHGRLPVKQDMLKDKSIADMYAQYKLQSQPKVPKVSKIEVLPETPVIRKKRPLFEAGSPVILFKKTKQTPKKLEAEFGFDVQDTMVSEAESVEATNTPKKFTFTDNRSVQQFKSPAARPTLRLSQKLQTKPSLANVLESPAPVQKCEFQSTIEDSVLAQLDLGQIDGPPVFEDDQPFHEEVVHLTKRWVKKPIMGKRQTSKRKLEPVYKSKEVTETKSKRQSRGPARLKMKQSVDFTKADSVKSKLQYRK